MRKVLSIAVGVALALGASSAFAQDNPPPPAGGTTTGGTGTATGTVGGTTETTTVTPPKVTTTTTTTQGASDAKKDAKDDGTTDHEKVVGHFGVGYLGLTQLPIGAGAPNAATRATIDAPVIGMRYWIMERLGIDAGIGFTFFNSSSEVEAANTTTTVDGPAAFGLGIHGGVPLAFAYGKHYKFLLVPELNVGFTTRTEKQAGANPPPDIKRGGFRLDAGARIGTEIQFGFIGIPELALQASVGLAFRHLNYHNSQDGANGAPPTSSSISENAIGTTVQSDPWALFVNNISALYYFP